MQENLYKPKAYRSLCRALCTLTGTTIPAAGTREAELVTHVVRTMAALNKAPAACLAAGLEENIIQTLLNILPQPRKELGKITMTSVTLMPTTKVNSVLVGNTARCLMPYADDATAGASLYQDRSLFGVEKLICSMAACAEMPVRQNLSVLLAKGCRLEGVREVVTEFRGMQMMQELQSKYKL